VLWVDTPGERASVRRADMIKNALRRKLGLAALTPSLDASAAPGADGFGQYMCRVSVDVLKVTFVVLYITIIVSCHSPGKLMTARPHSRACADTAAAVHEIPEPVQAMTRAVLLTRSADCAAAPAAPREVPRRRGACGLAGLPRTWMCRVCRA
jgi:hypothetical protein